MKKYTVEYRVTEERDRWLVSRVTGTFSWTIARYREEACARAVAATMQDWAEHEEETICAREWESEFDAAFPGGER